MSSSNLLVRSIKEKVFKAKKKYETKNNVFATCLPERNPEKKLRNPKCCAKIPQE